MKKRQSLPAPYIAGDRVVLLTSIAAKKYGTPGVAGEVLASTSESTWVAFKRADGERDVWVPNELLVLFTR